MRTERPRVRRLVLATCAVVLLVGVPASPAYAAVGATPVAPGLNNPAAFTFAPDGRIFYGERLTGQVRIFNPANGSNTLFYTVTNVSTDGEQGLLGIALDPNYPAEPFVYVYVTRNFTGVPTNYILRLRDLGGTGALPRSGTIYSAPAATVHNGGRILFGPDGLLYAVTGDAQSPANSQNLGNTLGKVLRMTRFGGVPEGNPFPGSLIYAYGFRNSFGMAFDPEFRVLWQTENGPACNDEINRVLKGLNYGWGPNQTCQTPVPPPQNTNRDGPNPVMPKAFYNPTTAPTGNAFCAGCGLGPTSEGSMYYGTYNTRQIRQVTFDARHRNITGESLAYTHSAGILSVERAPDGRLYFSTAGGIFRLTFT